MNELHTLAWYRKNIMPNLPKEIYKPVPSRLIGGAAHIIVIIIGILTINSFNLSLLVKLIIAAILGSSFAAIGFLGHEILHGTVVRNPLIKNLFGAICFWPLNVGPRLWIRWHNMNHHAYTQDEDLDPDAWLSIEELENEPLINWVYRLPIGVRSIFGFISLIYTFTGHSLMMLVRYLKDMNLREKLSAIIQLILSWATWIGLLFLIGADNWIFAYLLPLFIGNFIVMSYISTNHRLNPLVSINDPLANSLSVIVPKWIDILHFNFSYHTEHHLFSGVNPKYYPLIKEQIKKLWPEKYHEMQLGKALMALWKTPRIYYNKSELIDPHQGNIYGSLGNGLNPNNINYRKIEIKKGC